MVPRNRAELNQLIASYKAKQAELDAARPELEKAQAELKQTRAELEQARADLGSSQSALQAAEAQEQEYVEQLKRSQAEIQNVKRRVENEKQDQINRGIGELVKSLLPVLDAFDAARAQPQAAAADEAANTAAIAQLMEAALERAGLQRINAAGATFDANEHEAIATVPAAAPPAQPGADPAAQHPVQPVAEEQYVVDEQQAGYRFNGQVIRTSKVRVGTRRGK